MGATEGEGPSDGPGDPPDLSASLPTELHLLAIFRTREQADDAARELRDAGFPERTIRVDAERDRQVSLRLEMNEETGEGWVLPQAGVAYPKEAAKGIAAIGVPATIIGALVCVPFGFIDFGHLGLWFRLLLMLVLGGFFGGSIGFVVGPALAAKRPNEPIAAQRGVPLRLGTDTVRARALLVGLDPIRLDRIHGDTELKHDTVMTESDTTPEGILEEIERNAEDWAREDLPGHPPPGHETPD